MVDLIGVAFILLIIGILYFCIGCYSWLTEINIVKKEAELELYKKKSEIDLKAAIVMKSSGEFNPAEEMKLINTIYTDLTDKYITVFICEHHTIDSKEAALNAKIPNDDAKAKIIDELVDSTFHILSDAYINRITTLYFKGLKDMVRMEITKQINKALFIIITNRKNIGNIELKKKEIAAQSKIKDSLRQFLKQYNIKDIRPISKLANDLNGFTKNELAEFIKSDSPSMSLMAKQYNDLLDMAESISVTPNEIVNMLSDIHSTYMADYN